MRARNEAYHTCESSLILELPRFSLDDANRTAENRARNSKRENWNGKKSRIELSNLLNLESQVSLSLSLPPIFFSWLGFHDPSKLNVIHFAHIFHEMIEILERVRGIIMTQLSHEWTDLENDENSFSLPFIAIRRTHLLESPKFN